MRKLLKAITRLCHRAIYGPPETKPPIGLTEREYVMLMYDKGTFQYSDIDLGFIVRRLADTGYVTHLDQKQRELVLKAGSAIIAKEATDDYWYGVQMNAEAEAREENSDETS